MSKKVTFITPIGTLVWPKLDVIDVYQPVDSRGRPMGAEKRRYITRMTFDPKDLAKVQKFLEDTAATLLPDNPSAKVPVKKDKKTGEFYIEATSGEKFRPAVFDAKNNKLPEGLPIGGGTKARLDLTVNPYEGFGGGINLYINAVQVIELVEKGTGKSNFDETDGFTYGGEDEKEPESFGSGKADKFQL